MLLQDMRENIDEYLKRKSWYWYLPFWIFGVYLFFILIKFKLTDQQPFIIAVPFAFDFFLHEMAHIVTAFLPQVLTAAAGSLSEMLLGILLVYGAFKTRCYFASLLCALWLMLAFQSAGQYMADARAQQLPLVSLGGELSGSTTVIHDWNFVFGKLHILNLDTFIGDTVRGIGILTGLAAIGFTAWLMYKMAAVDQSGALNKEEAELLNYSVAAKGKRPAPVEHYLSINEGSLYPVATRGVLADKPDLTETKKEK